MISYHLALVFFFPSSSRLFSTNAIHCIHLIDTFVLHRAHFLPWHTIARSLATTISCLLPLFFSPLFTWFHYSYHFAIHHSPETDSGGGGSSSHGDDDDDHKDDEDDGILCDRSIQSSSYLLCVLCILFFVPAVVVVVASLSCSCVWAGGDLCKIVSPSLLPPLAFVSHLWSLVTHRSAFSPGFNFTSTRFTYRNYTGHLMYRVLNLLKKSTTHCNWPFFLSLLYETLFHVASVFAPLLLVHLKYCFTLP